MKRIIYRNLALILLVDTIIFMISLLLGYAVRFDFTLNTQLLIQAMYVLPLVVGVKIIVFHYCGLYKGMWRYTSTSDVINIVKAATASTLMISFVILNWNRYEGFARSVFVIDWCFTILLITSSRVAIRFFFENNTDNIGFIKVMSKLFFGFRHKRSSAKKLLIIGAGDSGEKIFREIRDNAGLKYQVVGFLDDHPGKMGMRIHGIPVLGNIQEIGFIVKNVDVDEVLIAIPSATSKQMREIVNLCEGVQIPFKTIPGIGELINGQLSVSSIREVSYNDLLGREDIQLDETMISSNIVGKVVLVTGAAGSIGSELCRQICRFNPERIIMFERSESPLYEIDMELRKKYPDIDVIPRLADIQDYGQVKSAFAIYGPDIVFHAAAYKHVPMLEHQAWKAVKNNVFGTANVARCALEYEVDRFVLVSTDKAVRPTNIMGASKRIAELFIQKISSENQGKTQFMTVRFGNVVGSAGSVLPLFRKQIANGGPLTVTHREITRFFMTIPEASQLILQAGAMGEGGEIFILDMGTPIKIADIARDMIKLSGLIPDEDIKIEYVGLRPGEKLYEELIIEGEGIIPTEHKKIMVLRGGGDHCTLLKAYYEKLEAAMKDQDGIRIMKLFMKIVPEYAPPKNYQEIEHKLRICQ